MFKPFNPKYCPILGIDIGSSAVKIVELSGSKDRPHITGYGSALLPRGALDGNVIKDINAVTSCIKKIIVKAHLSARNVSVAVPDSAVISKVVQFDAGLTAQELEELVVIEASKYIPYPLDEIKLDFEIQGCSAPNSTFLDVLIVASRAEHVHSRVEAVTCAGLKPLVVDVESYAIERAASLLVNALPAKGQNKIIAIVDIGAHYTRLFVLNNMKLVFSREEQFGAMQFIDAIAQRYNWTHEHAMQVKVTNQLPAGYEQELLEPFKEAVLLQIKRALHFFYSIDQLGFVEQIILAGGIAWQPGLAQLIQDQLNISTSIANPFSLMSLGKQAQVNASHIEASSLLVACGLALRNLK